MRRWSPAPRHSRSARQEDGSHDAEIALIAPGIAAYATLLFPRPRGRCFPPAPQIGPVARASVVLRLAFVNLLLEARWPVWRRANGPVRDAHVLYLRYARGDAPEEPRDRPAERDAAMNDRTPPL